MSRCTIVGLTGGIACGKSTVARTFRSHGIPVVDADVVARQVVEPGTFGLHCLGLEFGDDYVLDKGILDREALGRLVFADKKAMAKLNDIMGPFIQKESQRQFDVLHEQGHKIVVYDGALICEMGNANKYRPLIVVHCPKNMQVERLIKRNNLTEAEALARIDAQLPLEEKKKFADYLIDTSGTIEESVAQTKKIIESIYKI